MPHPEYQYLNLIKDILDNGSKKPIFFTPEVLAEYEKKGQEPPIYFPSLAASIVGTWLTVFRS
jgi:hypothetical protein